MLHGLKVVIHQDAEKTAEMLADLLNDNSEIVFDTKKCIAHIQTSSSEFDISFYPLGTKWDEDFEFDVEPIDGGIVQDGDALDAVNYAFDFMPLDDNQTNISYVLKNTGNKNYYVQEYKAGEFGIYNKEDNRLYADCFESVEQAQEWYNAEVKHNEKLKVLNDAIFEDIENAIESLKKEDDEVPCIYCKENPSNHFLCDSCGELKSFAEDAKFYHIQNTIQEIVGMRFKDKADLELFLQNKHKIKTLDNVDESGLVGDYAFIGSIFEGHGYLDIYYLKIPFGEETTYITEVNAINE